MSATTTALEVHVLDKTHREPLPDATVVVGELAARTDPCGIAVLVGLEPGSHDVSVYLPNYM